jgi:hypothetical protein
VANNRNILRRPENWVGTWESIGPASGRPSCAFRSPNLWDCFLASPNGARNIDFLLRAIHFDGSRWGPWSQSIEPGTLQVAYTRGPICVTPGSNRIHCFVVLRKSNREPDRLMERIWDGRLWQDWVDLTAVPQPKQEPLGSRTTYPTYPPLISSDLECLVGTTHRIHCFIRSRADGGAWAYWPWRRIGSTPLRNNFSPKCVTAGSVIRCFVVENGLLFMSTLVEDQAGNFVSTEWIRLAHQGGPVPTVLTSCVSWRWSFYQNSKIHLRLDCFAKAANGNTLHRFVKYGS